MAGAVFNQKSRQRCAAGLAGAGGSMSNSLNFVEGGTREVAAICREGVLVAGHFGADGAAKAAIDRLTDYRAVWSTLNPLSTLPQGRTLNPPQLTRGARVGAASVSRRVSLLFDFDPPRPKDTMSTDAEHEAALRQAEECRTHLRSLGWPHLPLCDSGSGAHLRAYVDLDTEHREHLARAARAPGTKAAIQLLGLYDV